MGTFDGASVAHAATALGKGTKAGDDLKARAERITGLEDQVKDLARQAKEIKAQVAEEYEDAAGAGYNKRVLRQVIKEMALDADERQAVFDFESEVDVYRHALGIESAAEMVVNEMTETEKLKTRVFGPGSDEAKEAIESARGRVNKKAREKADGRAGSIIDAAMKHGVATGKLTDNGDGTYDMPATKDGTRATIQVVR